MVLVPRKIWHFNICNSFVIWNSSYQHDSYNIKRLTNPKSHVYWLFENIMASWCNAFKNWFNILFFLMSILVIFQLSNSHPHPPPPKHTHTQTPRNWVRDKLPNLISITLWYLAFNRHTERNHSCIHVIITIVLMMMEYMISVVFHSYVFCFMYLYTF